MILPQGYIDASSNTASRLSTEPYATGQCSFDTSVARATAGGSRYQHHSTLAALLVAACDEINRLRTEVVELDRNEERIRSLCEYRKGWNNGYNIEHLAADIFAILDGEDET